MINTIINSLKSLKSDIMTGADAHKHIDKINEIIQMCEQYVPPDPVISQEEFAALSAATGQQISVYFANATINVSPPTPSE